MRYPYSVERKLLDQISSNDHFVFTTDLEANITFCNDAFQRLYQIVGESVQGVNIDSLINSTDAGLIKDTIHQTLLTKSTNPINLKLKHPGINSSENIIHYEFSVVNDRRSYPIAFLLIGKTAAASVLQSNATTSTNAGGAGISGQNREWFREIADYMKEMMWMSNHQHQINFVNKAWLKFRGVSLENESGNGWMGFIWKTNTR